MYNTMKKIFVTCMLILGTIMGAGFCSGKEIVAYFAKFGLNSLFFVPLLFFLYYFIFKIFMTLGAKENFTDIKQVNKKIFDKISGISNILLVFVYVIFTSAMFAGVYQIGQMFNSDFLSALFLAIAFILGYFLLLKPINFLKIFNAFLVPSLLVLILLTCLTGLFTFGVNSYHIIEIKNAFLMMFNPIIYACQGLALAYFILVKAGENLTEKQIKISAFASSLILCTLQTLAILVFCFNPELLTKTMPIVSLATKLGFPYDIIYISVLFVAILTTLFASSRSLNEIVSMKINNKYEAGFVTLFSALIFSLLGFDKIIEYLYPIIGCIGFYLLFTLTYKSSFVKGFEFTDKKIHKGSK